MATDDPAVTRAKLVPWQGNTLLDAQAIDVAFNPVSLKVALSNQLKTDAGNKGKAQSAAQFVDKSASTLSFDLVFDTSLDYSDVREQTRKIAERFMKPVAPGEPGYSGDGKQPTVPRRLRFQWGKFGFDGLMQSYAETLDYFSPDGVPLRATLSLTLAEDRFQHFSLPGEPPLARTPPQFAPAGGATTVPEADRAAGADPGRDWRATALFNGLETPRFTAGVGVGAGIGVDAGAGVFVPPGPAPSLGGGFTFGASARLGTHLGAAVETPAPAVRAGVSIRFGV